MCATRAHTHTDWRRGRGVGVDPSPTGCPEDIQEARTTQADEVGRGVGRLDIWVREGGHLYMYIITAETSIIAWTRHPALGRFGLEPMVSHRIRTLGSSTANKRDPPDHESFKHSMCTRAGARLVPHRACWATCGAGTECALLERAWRPFRSQRPSGRVFDTGKTESRKLYNSRSARSSKAGMRPEHGLISNMIERTSFRSGGS